MMSVDDWEWTENINVTTLPNIGHTRWWLRTRTQYRCRRRTASHVSRTQGEAKVDPLISTNPPAFWGFWGQKPNIMVDKTECFTHRLWQLSVNQSCLSTHGFGVLQTKKNHMLHPPRPIYFYREVFLLLSHAQCFNPANLFLSRNIFTPVPCSML